MKTTFWSATLALLVTLTTSTQAQTSPRVEAAWARPTVAGQSGGGGFLKITGGSANDRLISASAGVSKVVELHTMEMDGNVMRMRQIDAIDIPAGGTVELKPGGRHVMFMGLTQTLKAGERFPLTLRFEKAGEVKVDVQIAVQAPAGAAPAAPAAEHKH
jgi:copper(I)-binding protein